jgi:hypothetical protein
LFNLELYLLDDTSTPPLAGLEVNYSPSVYKIPVRATFISAASVIPYTVILLIVFGSNLCIEDKGMVNRLLLLLLVALRSRTVGKYLPILGLMIIYLG